MTTPTLAQLLSNAAATGPWVWFNGGNAAFSVMGTFAGATVTLQKLAADNATPVAVGGSTTVTAAAEVQGLNLPPGSYRCLVAGGPPSGLYASLSAAVN